jgi:DNA polymerase elongation subunit (family B)
MHIPVYGNTNRPQHYISTNFHTPLNSSHVLRTWFLDIETRSINGFAQPSNPIEAISMIQIWDSFEKTFFILATRDCNNIPTSEYGKVVYLTYLSEKDMMNAFLDLIEEKDPTIVCGFNSNFFDIPYITNRLDMLKINKKRLSPIGVVTSTETTTPEKIEYTKFDWVGRYLLDYRELFLKYSYDKLPKNSLEYVATHVLGVGKVQKGEYLSLEELYLNDYDTFVQYGITDVELLIQMDEKLKFIDTAKLIAYTCGVNIYDVFGTLKQWSSFMYNEAMKVNKVLPISQEHNDPSAVFVGGWVKSTPGKHNWVISFDFSSLYPSNIRLLNIGVDTLVKDEELPDELRELKRKYFNYYTQRNISIIEASNNNQEELEFFKQLITNKEEISNTLKKYNVTASPNGCFYRKDIESVFAGLMGRIYADRKVEQKEAKKYKASIDNKTATDEDKEKYQYHDLMQHTLKILMNSSYGSTALKYNPFSFGERMAASITTTGRFANRMVAVNVNNKIKDLTKSKIDTNKAPFTIQADTDSNYFNVADIMKLKFPDGITDINEGLRVAESIADKVLDPVIKLTIKDINETLNVYNPDVLDMELETIADAFVSVADKRYFCRYYTKSGEPKYKITGLSLIGKSTPEWCKKKLKPILPIIADGDSKQIIEFIEETKKEFASAELKDICVVKGVSNINYELEADGKFYRYNENNKKLSAPFHSRGCIIHNMMIDKLEMKHTKIKGGDKVYILPLLTPNPCFNSNVICYIDPKMIDELNIGNYIDYNTMFIKNYKANIELITERIGWSLNAFQGLIDEWE